MGVPAFFRKLVKKYKIIRKNIDGEIKSLYIDANCLFHPQCFKELDLNNNVSDQQILADKMFNRIIAYIDYLIKTVNPKELVYIAVDGVAPLAKISQQRTRRFGYANNYRHKIYRKYGIPFNDNWNNIVITPGTDFMYDLHLRLKNYYKNKVKIDTDNCEYNIKYSSYKTPGEGEHKILQHMKLHTSQNEQNATVIYGLDADLIFLSMASRIPNIFLLREEDQFAKIVDADGGPLSNNDKNFVEEPLCFADIDFAKKSINEEFNFYYKKFICQEPDALANILNFEDDDQIDKNNKNDSNIENIAEQKNDTVNNINRYEDFDFTADYIFICYFLGNDFLPHLPSIDIHVDGLETLFDVYMNIFEEQGVNLITFQNDKININDQFLFEFITRLAMCEERFFSESLQEQHIKHRRKRCFDNEEYKREIWRIENLKDNVKISNPVRLGFGKSDEWKFRYYAHYFKTSEYMQESVDKICHNYIEGLLWVAKYYFESCPSWQWSYRYTHAPFLSDIMRYIKNKKIMTDFNVEYAKPIEIYTQLVGVIPPTYSHILPEPLRHLNNSIDSPIIDMFPLTYEMDRLYKTQLYKCIPIIPYLDIDRVAAAVKSIKLSEHDTNKITYCDDFMFERYENVKIKSGKIKISTSTKNKSKTIKCSDAKDVKKYMKKDVKKSKSTKNRDL